MFVVIRRSLRLGVRLGLLAGIALALFKLVQGRRSADLPAPSEGWATPPPPPPTPGTAPEPELVKPVMLEEIIEKKKSGDPSDTVAAAPGASVVKKSAPTKKAAPARKAAAPVDNNAPVRKAAAKKAAPVKKAPKKQG